MTETTTPQGKRPPHRRRAVLGIGVVAAAVVAAALATGWFGLADAEAQAGDGAAQAEMPPMPVDVATARHETVADVVRATGRVEAVQAIELMPDEQGRIVELLFREGQFVQAGTPLIQIDDAIVRAQAERARAERDLAEQQLERARRLRAENASAPADLERAEAQARSAEAELALLELRIERSTVRAPFSGVVGRRLVSLGDYVTTASPLLTLHTVDPQHVVIDVPERHAVALREGQTVQFTIAAQRERTFNAEVEFIDPLVQDVNRTIIVKARAPNPDGVLRPGMFVEARLATGTRDGAVVVPEDAIQPLRTGNVAWAMVDGQASRRMVQLGARSRGFVEVLDGIEAGEQVVIGGLDMMAEGMPIAPRSPSAGEDQPAETNGESSRESN